MEHSQSLYDNHSKANNRLQTLVKSFKKNRYFPCQYIDIILRHITQRIAERVNQNESCDYSKIYYIPHHAVKH